MKQPGRPSLSNLTAPARTVLVLAAVLCGAQLLAAQHLHLSGGGTELCAACVLADSGDRSCVAPAAFASFVPQGRAENRPPSVHLHAAPARLSNHTRAPPVSRC